MQVTFGSLRDGGQKQPAFPSMNTPQTRRLTILNADEIAAIFGLPQFTEDERQVHFALSPIESEVVNAARTITAAVHLTLQIGYFKAKLRISAIVDACYRLIVDGVSAPSWTRRGCAQARS